MASRILKSNYPGLVYKANLTAVPADLRYDPTNGNVELVQQGPGGKVLMGLSGGSLGFTNYGQSVLQFFDPNLPQSAQMPAEPFAALIINDVRAAAAAVGGKLPSGRDFQRGGTQPAPATPPAGQPPRTTPESAAAGPESPAAADETIGGLKPFNPGDFEQRKSFGPLKYPDSINSGQDRIIITQFQYKRSGVLQREGNFNNVLGEKNEDKSLKNVVGSVTLPMPNDISETNSVGWGEDSLSNIAAGAMGALGDVTAGVAGANLGQIKEGLTTLESFLKSEGVGTRARQFLTVKAAAGIVGKLGVQVNPEAFITRSTGAAINPNLELLFNGPKLRQFGFQFKMTPRDKGEADQIRRIIRFFKQGMSPRKGIKEETSFFLGTPNVFKLQFKSGNSELKSIGKIKTCALVSFAVNYTPDGFYAAYTDPAAGGSQPVSVIIQLGFTELTPIFNDEYDDNQDDIGPNKTPAAGPLVPPPKPGDPDFIGPVPNPPNRPRPRNRRGGG